MEQQRKVDCWRNIYAFLEPYEEVVDLHKPEDAKNLELVCKIGGAKVDYLLNLNNDLLMMRAEIPCPDKSNDDILDFGKKITKGFDGDISAYPVNGALTIMSRFVFTGSPDEVASDMVDERGRAFFKYLIENEETIMAYTKEPPRKRYKKTGSGMNENKKVEPQGATSPPAGKKENVVKSLSGDSEKNDSKPKVKDAGAATSAIRKMMEQEVSSAKKTATPARASKEEQEMKEKIARFEDEKKKFEKEKASFLQYQKDQRLVNNKKEADIARLRKEVDEAKARLNEERAKFDKERKSLDEELNSLKTEKIRLKALSSSLTEDRKLFEEEKENWNKTTPDERILARREELSSLEDSFCEKEEAFQTFRSESLKEIESRMADAEKKEAAVAGKYEELARQKHDFEKRVADANDRDLKLKEKEAILINKEAELSDKEAELKRSAIIKVDAENMQKQLQIMEKKIKRDKEKLLEDQAELQVKQNDFIEKYDRVIKSIDSMDKKEAEIKEKELQVSRMIQQYEQMKDDSSRPDNEKLTEEVRILSDSVSKKDQEISRLNALLKDINLKYDTVSKERDSLRSDVSNASNMEDSLKEEKEALELALAEIRGELFEAREMLNSKKEVPTRDPDDVERIAVLEDKITELKSNLKTVLDENELLIASKKDVDEKALSEKEEEIAALKRRLSVLEDEISEKEEEIDNLMENRAEIVEVPEDQPESIDDLLARLKDSGYEFEEELSENMGLYVAEKDGCKIHYNVEYEMLQVEKVLKKRFKNIAELRRLNNIDMSMSFIVNNSGKKSVLICRKTIQEDPVEDIRTIMKEFNAFA